MQNYLVLSNAILFHQLKKNALYDHAYIYSRTINAKFLGNMIVQYHIKFKTFLYRAIQKADKQEDE